MNEFDFKPVDLEGEETLKTIALADHFNRWMFDTIRPYCTGNILEIGSGLGNISEFFLRAQANIYLTDIRKSYCEGLRRKFGRNQSLLGVETMDLVDKDFDAKFSKHFNQFDTVFALNVVEHIFDDRQALINCHKLIKTGGHLIILVPANQWLYNNFDKELEHYRRYNKKGLEKLFSFAGFSVLGTQYFNAAGMAGWFISGKIQHHKIIPEGQIRLYNRLVALFRLFDRLILNSFGLSVITVGKK